MHYQILEYIKQLFSKTGFCTLFIALLVVFNSTNLKAQWVDKNESENYIARHECSVVQAGNKFYVLGGRESAKTIDVYNYAANSWARISNSAPEEFNHFQATEYKGMIWIIGAFKTNAYPSEQPTEYIWAFNPANQEWIKGPSIPVNRRRGSTGLVVYNDKFYISGGNTIGHNGGYVPWFDEYNPATGTWTPLANAPRARDHFHAGVIGNKMYLAGGRLSGGEEGVFKPVIAEVDVYNFNTSQWSTLAQNLPTPRGAPAVAVFNSKLVVIGGEVENEIVYGVQTTDALSITEEYDPTTQTWTRIADLNHKRHGTQAIVSGNGIFVLAGSPNKGGGNQKNMEYLGQDAPVGSASTASTLIVPSSLTVDPNTSGNFDIDITGGNVGVIVRSMQISGAGTSNFQITSGDLTNALLDAGSSKQVTISHNGATSGANAILTINYGASSSIDIELNVNNPTPTYSISSSAGPNGTISPLGNTNVSAGSNQEYIITADAGFAITNVLVDGNSIGAVTNYTFNNVSQAHTISASFEAISISYIITATAATGGTITPSGDTNVSEGSNQQYTITPNTGFTISDVTVDGSSVSVVQDYTFTNVIETHTINVSFEAIQNSHSITATAGNGGTITPSGEKSVAEGSNQQYTITPNAGFYVKDVLVDGSSIGTVQDYSFTNVTEAHTISASFETIQNSHNITATAGTGGTITPSGETNVAEGSDQEFIIMVDTDFIVADIIVNNVSVGVGETYSFTNVTENQTINVVFTQVNNDPPIALAIANLYEGVAPLSIEFDGSGSSDDKGIIGYAWDFGNDSAINTAISPTYVYTESGMYNVVLSVEDSDGIITTSTITITVTDSTEYQFPETEIKELLIYPNPVSDEVTMKLPDSEEIVSISLFDISGKYIQTLIPSLLDQASGYSINIRTLPPGIYGVKVLGISGNEFQQKLLVRK